MRTLVTGSSGLIGSEAVQFFDALGFPVVGVDNNMRADFFGAEADTQWNRARLEAQCRDFTPVDLDIRDRRGVDRLFAEHAFDLIIHAAAQPSHDLAARRPFDDFDVNAGGTLNLLEACRRRSPEAVFIYVSTNKVYGDGPNRLPMIELDTRYDFADPIHRRGIGEAFPIDQSMHSLFGASKASADLMVQEYGRYFGMRTGVFRGGCLTGPQHAGVQLHGFLSHLVSCALRGERYTVFGHKGKQVRDQIHARDVVRAFWAFAKRPCAGEVYNIGGGRDNAASLIECARMVEQAVGAPLAMEYEPTSRLGDHICYYTDVSKLRCHYPEWRPTHSLPNIIEQMIAAAADRRTRRAAEPAQSEPSVQQS